MREKLGKMIRNVLSLKVQIKVYSSVDLDRATKMYTDHYTRGSYMMLFATCLEVMDIKKDNVIRMLLGACRYACWSDLDPQGWYMLVQQTKNFSGEFFSLLLWEDFYFVQEKDTKRKRGSVFSLSSFWMFNQTSLFWSESCVDIFLLSFVVFTFYTFT